MQPDIMETDFTRAAREVVDRANALIDERMSSFDLSTFEGQYGAAASRFQRQVLSALILWIASEDERGTPHPVLMTAIENGIANCIASVLHGRVKPPMRVEAAQHMLHQIMRDTFVMLQVAECDPRHAEILQARSVKVGRA